MKIVAKIPEHQYIIDSHKFASISADHCLCSNCGAIIVLSVDIPGTYYLEHYPSLNFYAHYGYSEPIKIYTCSEIILEQIIK